MWYINHLLEFRNALKSRQKDDYCLINNEVEKLITII